MGTSCSLASDPNHQQNHNINESEPGTSDQQKNEISQSIITDQDFRIAAGPHLSDDRHSVSHESSRIAATPRTRNKRPVLMSGNAFVSVAQRGVAEASEKSFSLRRWMDSVSVGSRQQPVTSDGVLSESLEDHGLHSYAEPSSYQTEVVTCDDQRRE